MKIRTTGPSLKRVTTPIPHLPPCPGQSTGPPAAAKPRPKLLLLLAISLRRWTATAHQNRGLGLTSVRTTDARAAPSDAPVRRCQGSIRGIPVGHAVGDSAHKLSGMIEQVKRIALIGSMCHPELLEPAIRELGQGTECWNPGSPPRNLVNVEKGHWHCATDWADEVTTVCKQDGAIWRRDGW